ncbi:MAG TPA: hypothetical protein PLI60_07985, partial [Anaerolineaceae bacterium]|nr:hypothetical protein [Anaerolineaceae bacterium]
MVVTFGYKQRNSLVETFDPRARWIFSILSLFTIVNFWDIRFLLYFLLVSVVQYSFTRLTWKETKRAWRFIFFLMFIMIFVNTIVTSAGTISDVSANPHVLFAIEKPIRFTYIGTLVAHKGLHVLIEAFNRLPKDSAVLNVYGNTGEFTDYVQ